MEITNAPTKQSLFSALASHEIGQAGMSQQGIRPRLPNRFEAIDTNKDISAFDEQLESSTYLPNIGVRNQPSEPVGLRTLNSHFHQENDRQPDVRRAFQTSSTEPEPVTEKAKDRSPTLDLQPSRSRLSNLEDTSAAKASHQKPSIPESLQLLHGNDLHHEKTIVEKQSSFERETLREINNPKTTPPEFSRQTGLTPKMQPVKGITPPPLEKVAQPNIEIHIGRIEVRALIQQATQPKPEKVPASSTNEVALQAYLQNRSRGARS